MKLAIAAITVAVSLFMGYLKYINHRSIYQGNVFFVELCNALLSNNKHEMLPFHEIFNQEYNKYISNECRFEACDEVLNFLESEGFSALGKGEIVQCLRSYLSCTSDDLNVFGDELKQKALEYMQKATVHLKENGTVALSLYPAVSVIALIVMS